MFQKGSSAVAVGLIGVGLIVLCAGQGGEDGPSSDPERSSGLEYANTLLVPSRVADLDRSITFYRDVLDFSLSSKNDTLKWAKVKPGIDGVTVGIGEGEDGQGSGTVSMTFGVKDVDAARKILESRGVEFLGPTITIPDTVRLADFHDPDGNKIRLAQSLAPADGN